MRVSRLSPPLWCPVLSGAVPTALREHVRQTANAGKTCPRKAVGTAPNVIVPFGNPFPSRRSGFTLLEVLLASAIALLLLGGLYVALEVELSQASAGRELVERSTLARGLATRIKIDLSPCITPLRATPQSGSAAPATTSSTTTPTPAAPAAVQTSGVIPPQAGVIGTSQMLTIFTTRVPDPKPKAADGSELSTGPFPSDIRRIYYWFGTNGGLCRREIPWFSQEQLQTTSDQPLFDSEDESKFVIANEVVDLQFEYYDINETTTDDGGWTKDGTWDGSALGPDGVTPKGPPTAIRVTFTIKSKDGFTGKESNKVYRHTIQIVTASGPMPMSSAPMNGTTTTP